MLKIFKKNNTKNTVITKEILKNYPKEVLEIHNEFEIASEKLLKQANDIINSLPKVNESKINILKSLGFNQVKEVKESSQILNKLEISEEQIKLVNYYQHNYPFNKFITEEQVKIICHKYNLVCGDVNRFKGFVPEKNMNDIIQFKLKNKEKDILFAVFKPYYENKSYNIELKDAEIINTGDYFHIYKKNNINGSYAFQSDNGIKFYGNDSNNIFGYKHLGSGRFTIENSLKICAPIKDMDISGLELENGYKLKEKHIPDPVVLQPVKGGYLILTAWGDEASDELVLNQNHN